MSDSNTTPSIVVGVDGSKSAINAVLWAVDEAVARDLPLRLVHVVEEHLEKDTDTAALADAAVAEACAAIRATGKPVTIQTEIVRGHALTSLAEASQSAKMVCVGPVGRHLIAQHRVGSITAALVASAHCPVTIVRRTRPFDGGHIVVDLDESPTGVAVLESAMEEAKVLGAPLEVVTTWHTPAGDTHDQNALEEGNRRVRAQLERRLAQWIRRYPDVEVHPVAVHGSILDHLTKNARAIQLVVIGLGVPGGAGELLGPTGSAVLSKTDCSLLVVARHPM